MIQHDCDYFKSLKILQINILPLNSTRRTAQILNGLWSTDHKHAIPVRIYKKIRPNHVHNFCSLATIETEGPIMCHRGYGPELNALYNLVY